MIKLVDDWRKAKRWFSVHAMVLAMVIQAVWLELPADLKSTLDPKLVQWLTMILMIAGIVGRLIKQNGVDNAKV